MAQYDHTDWHGTTDGTPWMQRTLIRLFRFIPIVFFYGVTALVIPFYMLSDRRGYRASYRFFRRLGYSRVGSFFRVYANEFRLGQVVMDRFALYAGRRFHLDVDGQELFDRLKDSPEGFVQVRSHVGNPELAGYQLRVEGKRMHVLVFPGETQTVMQQREAVFSRMNITMVPVSTDLSHLFALNSALLDGDIVNMPGDRLFGSTKSFTCTFFGAPARFPAGPFLLAAQREVPMLALFVLKSGVRRYRVFVRAVGDASVTDGPARQRAEAMAQDFAGQLESVVRVYPTQWFNFYDFWQ